MPPAATFVVPKRAQAVVSADSQAHSEPTNPTPPETLLAREQNQRSWRARWLLLLDDPKMLSRAPKSFGETGSGKTSGSGAAIARAFLKKGFGGLILTAKSNIPYDWLHPDSGFLAQAGIDPHDPNKVVVLGEQLAPDLRPPTVDEPRPMDLTKSFNFLDYEYQRTGEATFNLVQLFLMALESGSQGNTGQEDAYWVDSLRQLLTNAIDLVIYATGRVTLPDILSVIQTAPQSREQARSNKWQTSNSTCWLMLRKPRLNCRRRAPKVNSSRHAGPSTRCRPVS